MMVRTRDEVIKTVAPIIEKNHAIELCILYGSAAADNLTDMSDVDLAVGSETGLTYQQCLTLSLELTHLLDREVSVIDLKKLEGVILGEVLTKGITLKSTNTSYKAGFIMKNMEFNEDILPFHHAGARKMIQEYLDGQ